MRYVVIEDFNGLVNFVLDPKEGMTAVFDNLDDAVKAAMDCQNGKIINLDAYKANKTDR